MRKLKFMIADSRMLMRFVVPSMLSMLTAGVYTIVDGLFVGWGAGSDGMAALNVAYPLALLLIAFGEMIGIGGAINIAIARGRGLQRTAQSVLNTMLLAVLPVAAILPLILLPNLEPLLSWMGAAPMLMPDAVKYAAIIVGGGVFQLASIALLEAIRNNDAPHRAMWILVGGLIANVILDYIFVIVLAWGVAGSAWATVLSQALSMALALHYFLREGSELRLGSGRWRPRRIILLRMLKAGIPSFGVQISIGVVIWLHNNRALAYGGVAAVAAYAIISYFESVILLMIQGIALGLQPVASFLHGGGRFLRRRRMAEYGIIFGVVFGVAGLFASVFGAGVIAEAFNAHGEVFALAVSGLVITASAYPLTGFQKVSESYFQATERHGAASLLIYLDSGVILPLCLFVLPYFYGLNGVWAALPVSKALIALVAWRLWRR